MVSFEKDDYRLEEANKKLFTEKNLHISNVVFIYTPMKVGSTTLVTSIRISAIHHFAVFHLHNVDCLRILTGITDVTIRELILYNSRIGKKVFVIDVYRSPIERKISTFFELIEMHFNNSMEEISNYHVDRVIRRFNDIFPHIANENYTRDLYNISLPGKFDIEKKYLCVSPECNPNVFYITLRLKDSAEWGGILTRLLGEEIVIIKDYETSEKKINTLYHIFKSHYRIPSNLLEEFVEKKDSHLDYYYSEKEKNEYIQEWGKKRGEPMVPFTRSEYELYMKITVENRKKSVIQTNHYMDLGCKCGVCDQKRSRIFDRAKRGEIIKERIDHHELVEEYQKKCVKKSEMLMDKRIRIMRKKRGLTSGAIGMMKIK